jgi:hypothetical protein
MFFFPSCHFLGLGLKTTCNNYDCISYLRYKWSHVQYRALFSYLWYRYSSVMIYMYTYSIDHCILTFVRGDLLWWYTHTVSPILFFPLVLEIVRNDIRVNHRQMFSYLWYRISFVMIHMYSIVHYRPKTSLQECISLFHIDKLRKQSPKLIMSLKPYYWLHEGHMTRSSILEICLLFTCILSSFHTKIGITFPDLI